MGVLYVLGVVRDREEDAIGVSVYSSNKVCDDTSHDQCSNYGSRN
jgi:hypothetical protein